MSAAVTTTTYQVGLGLSYLSYFESFVRDLPYGTNYVFSFNETSGSLLVGELSSFTRVGSYYTFQFSSPPSVYTITFSRRLVSDTGSVQTYPPTWTLTDNVSSLSVSIDSSTRALFCDLDGFPHLVERRSGYHLEALYCIALSACIFYLIRSIYRGKRYDDN